MNLFGPVQPVDGSGALLRKVVFGAAAVAIVSLASAAYLDHAARQGSLNRIGHWAGGSDLKSRTANLPRPTSGQPVAGVRYGGVDYMPTASTGGKSRFKNVLDDPSLGMPR